MNIKDLNFYNNVEESIKLSGGQGAFDSKSDRIEQRFYSLTGQVIGTFNAFSDVTANGSSTANASISSNTNSNTVNQVSFNFNTSTELLATTPGS